MAVFERIRNLREDADKTQAEVAAYLGTTAQYYGRYEKGECELPFSRAIQLADYYRVSLDFLAERSSEGESPAGTEREIGNMVLTMRRLTPQNLAVLKQIGLTLLKMQNNE